jgi:hypothetical protein
MYDIDMPYFLTNEEWYYEDENGIYQLTNKAPQKAIDSYNEFFDDTEDLEEL